MGELREIGKTSWLDAPKKFRELADEIEKEGNPHRTVVVILGGEDEEQIRVRACGPRSSPLETIGWVSLALALLTNPTTEEWISAGPAA